MKHLDLCSNLYLLSLDALIDALSACTLLLYLLNLKHPTETDRLGSLTSARLTPLVRDRLAATQRS